MNTNMSVNVSSKAKGTVSGGGAPRRSRLELLQRKAARSENLARLKALSRGQSVVESFPLAYLYSKPELRSYALELAVTRLIKPAQVGMQNTLRSAFSHWRAPKEQKLDDLQVGFLVIAKRFERMWQRYFHSFFSHWAHCYSSRFDMERYLMYADAAETIQDWYRNMKKRTRASYVNLHKAIQLCLQRRYAIRYTMRVELARRHAIEKMRKGIALRRRWHLAARGEQRQWKWLLLFRKTRWRLIRSHNARIVQRWRRMTLCRHKDDLAIIRYILTLGGYKVFSKVPQKLLNRWGQLKSISQCVSLIQKAYFASKGRMDLYMRFAARRAAAAHLQVDLQDSQALHCCLSFRFLFLASLFLSSFLRLFTPF